MLICKTLVFYGDSDKNDEIIEFIASTYTFREEELKYEPRIAQNVLHYITKCENLKSGKYYDFMMLLYNNIINPPVPVTDIYIYIDAIESLDTD